MIIYYTERFRSTLLFRNRMRNLSYLSFWADNTINWHYIGFQAIGNADEATFYRILRDLILHFIGV